MSVLTDGIIGPGIYPDIPEAEYHADVIVPGGSLSSTGARAILSSPARYAWDRDHPPTSAAFDVGTAVHTRVLGTGAKVDVLDFDSWRTDAAKDAAALSRANGRVPMLAKDYAPIDAMASRILAHKGARALLESPGQREVSVFAPDPATGVWMRGRIDHLSDDAIVDVKTATSAEPGAFGRKSAEYGYDVQAEWYSRLVGIVRGDVPPVLFVAVEKYPPYLVSVVELDAEYAQIGKSRADRALRTYAACVESGDWPGYGDDTHLVGPPTWLAYAEGMVI